jgi:type I restriction enzyme R subunit/putative DNA methylase
LHFIFENSRSPRDYQITMSFTRRNLPHWQPTGAHLFATWRLHGSLPRDRFPPVPIASGKAFTWMDRHLDEARTGPLWLTQEDIAHAVIDSMTYAAQTLRYCELDAYVVMANHVHTLLLPLVAPCKLFQSIKGFSARAANKLLGRMGEPFWENESYDHWARDAAEFARIIRYIENNPVRAGLASRPEEYRWSSAYGRAL